MKQQKGSEEGEMCNILTEGCKIMCITFWLRPANWVAEGYADPGTNSLLAWVLHSASYVVIYIETLRRFRKYKTTPSLCSIII